MFECLKARPIRRGLQVIAATLGLLPFAQVVQAVTTTTSSFTVQVQINATCVINSAQTLDFGTQTFLTANVDQQSKIQVQCTSTTPYNIGLNAGTASGATVTTRKMTSGANTVSYSLYSDSGRTTNWGNTVNTDTVSGTGTGSTIDHFVYGRIPPQAAAPGGYSDTIQVTVTY